jgi:pyruvate dehydrogenase E2 component (dihydrolipoamide acetyltransferase)
MLLEIKVPEAGFSITEGTVIEWFKSVGEEVHAGETVVAVETEKLSVDIPAESDGVLSEILHRAGETVPVGGVLGTIKRDAAPGETEGSAQRTQTAGKPPEEGKNGKKPAPEPELSELMDSKSGVGGKRRRRISPLAKAIARENALDLSVIERGSGPHGRIVKEDVIDLLEGAPRIEGFPAADMPEGPRRTVGVEGKDRAVFGRKQHYGGWRKVIADRMTASAREVPSYTMSVAIDMTEAASLVEKAREEEGPRVTYLHLVMKAVAMGVRMIPQVNAFCYPDGFELREDVNIGIAVDLGEKLLVPVLRNVQNRSVLEIAGETGWLVRKAREDRLEPSDVEGGTITVTNVGVYNIHSGTSIILQPQSSILYMGVVREEPAVVDGCVAVRRMMMLGGTFDHRLVHGGPGARFLEDVKSHLENPSALVLRLR